MDESHSTKLEKQLGGIFEATLEQKAIDVAEKTWAATFGKALIPDQEGMSKIVGALQGIAHNTSFDPYRSRKKLIEEDVRILYEEGCIHNLKPIIEKLFNEPSTKERLLKIAQNVITEILGEFEKDV